MAHKEQEKSSFRIFIIFSLLLFAAALALCMQIRFSDGDDAYFLEHTASRSLPEFVSWRYQTWSGRIMAESAIWICFRAGIFFWRVLNALMLTALPLLILRLVYGSILRLCEREGKQILRILVTVSAVYLLLSLQVAGYACIWITGSLNYLHGAVFATAALIPLKDVLDANAEKKSGLSGDSTDGGKRRPWKTAAAVLCAVLGAGYTEQIAAILLVLYALGTFVCFRLQEDYRVTAALTTAAVLAVMLISLLAPGNALRNATSEEWYFPGFSALPASTKLFLTVQFVLSSFSNENSLLFCIVSLAVFLLILQKKGLHLRIHMMAGFVTVISALAAMGAKYCSDMGTDLVLMQNVKATAPSWGQLLPEQRFAMLLWGILLLLSCSCLWIAFEHAPLPILIFLASVASAAVMGFSPTVYASGARSLFPSAWMLWLLLVMAYRRIAEERVRRICTVLLCAAGLLHGIVMLRQLMESALLL